MKRVKTGINGLDEMLNGGIPAQRHVLVTGGPGTGKTTFCMEYLYRGALNGEKGAFITLEESPEVVIENTIATFPKWTDFKNLIDKKIISVIKPDRTDFTSFSDIAQACCTQMKTTRLVIDSSTILKLSFDNPLEFRKKLVDFLSFARNLDATILMTAELSYPVRGKIHYSIEQFAADGVIILYNLEKAEKRVRALEILKMRGTDHSRDLVPMKFTPSGITVYQGEKVY